MYCIFVSIFHHSVLLPTLAYKVFRLIHFCDAKNFSFAWCSSNYLDIKSNFFFCLLSYFVLKLFSCLLQKLEKWAMAGFFCKNNSPNPLKFSLARETDTQKSWAFLENFDHAMIELTKTPILTHVFFSL
jgi:hypothetical protein